MQNDEKYKSFPKSNHSQKFQNFNRERNVLKVKAAGRTGITISTWSVHHENSS